MFFHVLYIHLFRPFLKYTPKNSPLPSNVSPRKFCTSAATAISKLMRLYKKSYGLRQICNIVVYILHSACTIHLLNLPEKTARRDITHGVKQLEEIAEAWLCARRALRVLSVQVRRWDIDLPEEAATVLKRTDEKFGAITSTLPKSSSMQSAPLETTQDQSMPMQEQNANVPDFWNDPADMSQSGDDMNYGIFDWSAQASDFGALSSGAMQATVSQMPEVQGLGNGNMAGFGVSPYGSFMQPSTSSSSTNASYGNPAVPSTAATPMLNSSKSSHMGSPHQRHLSEQSSSDQLSRARSYSSSLSSNQQGPTQTFDFALQQPSTSSFGLNQGLSSTSGFEQSFSQPSLSQAYQSMPPPNSIQKPGSGDRKFGGVHALLQDTQDFLVKDQSQLAKGFNNWTVPSENAAGGSSFSSTRHGYGSESSSPSGEASRA